MAYVMPRRVSTDTCPCTHLYFLSAPGPRNLLLAVMASWSSLRELPLPWPGAATINIDAIVNVSF